jgi:aerobic-type carbon monoxide dehydrogenase small subunit (CoxS/CutS family)
MTSAIRFHLNGKPTALEVDGSRRLLWVLRGELGLTGAKYGCGEGVCGACTVLVDGAAIHACATPVSAVAGKRVVTIEGLAAPERLHPLQEAFREHHALQCGFCTPGMLLTALDLLRTNPRPTEEEIRHGLSAVLCRCTGYQGIVAAVAAAAPALDRPR